MSDYYDWDRPRPDDEDEKAEQAPEQEHEAPVEEPEPSWPTYDRPSSARPSYEQSPYDRPSYEQPSADRPELESPWQRSDYGGYGDHGRYGENQVPRDPFLDDTHGSRYDERRSRDPLARLFPGLPRSVRVTLDWILTIVGAILIVLAL